MSCTKALVCVLNFSLALKFCLLLKSNPQFIRINQISAERQKRQLPNDKTILINKNKFSSRTCPEEQITFATACRKTINKDES